MALREEEAGGALAAGDRVRIKGLRARPDLNGKEGQVRRPPLNEQAPWSCARTAAPRCAAATQTQPSPPRRTQIASLPSAGGERFGVRLDGAAADAPPLGIKRCNFDHLSQSALVAIYRR